MGVSSWLGAVKRALRGSERKSDQEEEYHKKRDKRRWIFKQHLQYETRKEHKEDENIISPCNSETRRKSTDNRQLGFRTHVFEDEDAEQRRVLAVAMATSAAAVATAQAAMEVIRLATPSIIFFEHYAAVAIQTAFRGYLARRALQALKGVVKLQAFVRGYLVRKRAKMIIQCMQSLLRVQSQVCYQRKRLSTNSNFSPLRHFFQVAEMKSNSRHSTSSVTEDEVHTHKSKEAKLKRERSLVCAFSRQQEEESNPSEKSKAADIDMSEPCSPIFPQNQAQNLLINSLASPHRSRIRTLKAQPREREEENHGCRIPGRGHY